MNHDDIIKKAADTLRQGGIVIYPTDTAFGIGCRIDSRDSVDRLFRIRRRNVDHAMPVLVSSLDMALSYFLHPPAIAVSLAQKYWPGALTIVSKCDTDRIYSPIRGGTEKIGLRMPNHTIPLSFIHLLGVPILGPSANFHGDTTPFVFEDLDKKLMDLVDYVIPGECTIKQASTVVDCSTDPITIVRTGAIQLADSDMNRFI